METTEESCEKEQQKWPKAGNALSAEKEWPTEGDSGSVQKKQGNLTKGMKQFTETKVIWYRGYKEIWYTRK